MLLSRGEFGEWFMPVRAMLALSVLLLAVACGADSSIPPVTAPLTPVTPAPRSVRVRLQADTTGIVPGMSVAAYVFASDAAGATISTGAASLDSRNEGVVAIGDATRMPVIDARTGVRTEYLTARLIAVSAGTSTIVASIDGVRDSITIRVHEVRPGDAALQVESFSVVEYSPCTTGCSYLLYAPVLKLREPFGRTGAHVVAVEYNIPGLSSGLCRGLRAYAPGESGYVNGYDPYPWSNDILLVKLDGNPVIPGVAFARVYVVDAAGTVTQLDVTGPIERRPSATTLPPPDGGAWECH
jgi:hypothetical protein